MKLTSLPGATPYPPGTNVYPDGSVNFSVEAPGAADVQLVLEPLAECGFQETKVNLSENHIGNIFFIRLKGFPFDKVSYYYLVDGIPVTDPCSRVLYGKEIWGQKPEFVKCGILKGKPSNVKSRGIPLKDTIIYRLHVRGFSMKNGRKSAGTFQGLIEKLPYIHNLGATLIELMPAYDFDETPYRQKKKSARYYGTPEISCGINYWGYTTADYFAPKTSFSVEKTGPGAVKEFTKLVAAVHDLGMELGMEFYFPDDVSPMFACECLRHWVMQYGIDAVHLTCRDEIVRFVQAEPMLSSVKIFSNAWVVPAHIERDTEQKNRAEKHTATYQDSFLVNVRRFLMGEQNTVGAVKYEIRKNPRENGVINYLASHNTMTLADAVSYERKHNEANGEQNRDGTDYNFSANGGVEGPTARKSVLSYRRRQIKNELAMLFLSQGTPMIMAGDEWGHTQGGNNNPYNQDNDITWLSWKRTKFENDILACTKELISIRKENPIFHTGEELQGSDYRALGFPDLSWHGETAWQYSENPADRYFAAMYCGKYAQENTERLYYVAYNMSGEEKCFGVPSLPRGNMWVPLFATDELTSCDGKILTLAAHSVALYVSGGM